MQYNPDYHHDIRRGIAEHLRDQSILTEPLPDRFCELLAQLDRTDAPASTCGYESCN
jgi:Anti-sigma factor NepR